MTVERSRASHFKLTVSAVGNANTAPADARFDGQIRTLTLPTLVERVLTNDVGLVAPQVTTLGLEDMVISFTTPSAQSDFYKFLLNTCTLVVYVANTRTARAATTGIFQYEREIHTVEGILNSIDRGDIEFGGDNLTTVSVRATDLYKVEYKDVGGSDAELIEIDPRNHTLEVNGASMYSGLDAALTA